LEERRMLVNLGVKEATAPFRARLRFGLLGTVVSAWPAGRLADF